MLKQRLESLFMQAPVPICMLEGPEHEFVFINNAYSSLLGHRSVLGKKMAEALPEAVRQGFLPILDHVYRTGESFIGNEVAMTLEIKGVPQTGVYNLSYQPCLNAQGKVEGIFAIITDVTAQSMANKQIKESEEKYRSLTDALPQMMWTADAYGNVNFANQLCATYTGLAMEKKFIQNWISAIHPEDVEAVGHAWMQSIRRGEIFSGEYRMRGADGSYRWFLGRAVPIKNVLGKVLYWIGTATDIDEQHQMIEKLETERILREQFVATLTHDLRNPLMAAKMSAQLISRMPESNDKHLNLTGRIVDGLNRANQMIENLLDANRIKAGESLQLNLSEIDLCELVSKILLELTAIYGDRFDVDIPGRSIHGLCSEDGIRRLLENLCLNAIKYGSEMSKVTVRVSETSGRIKLSIHNMGNPVPQEELARMFAPFQRRQHDPGTRTKGWGLGLTIVKGIAEAHGGSVNVESSEEQGTIFTVEIPCSRHVGLNHHQEVADSFSQK